MTLKISKMAMASLLILATSTIVLANDSNDKSESTKSRTPVAQARHDALVKEVQQSIRVKLRVFKLTDGDTKRDTSDSFVVAKLEAIPSSGEVTAVFATVAGIEDGSHQIVDYLAATPSKHVRDYMILSRYHSANDAQKALSEIEGREAELASQVKQNLERQAVLRAQRIAQAQAKAAYLAQVRAAQRAAQLRSRSRGNSGYPASRGGGRSCGSGG